MVHPVPGPAVLIVAYSFPPNGGVGGLRPFRLAQALARRGWRVFVLTPEATGLASPSLPLSPAALAGVEVVRTRHALRAAVFHRLLPGRRTPVASVRAPGTLMPSAGSPHRNAAWLAMRALILFPDEQVGWLKDAVEEGTQLIERHAISVIVTTSPPETSHLVGARLKQRTGIPWVADFRDPWSFSHLRPPSLLDALHRRKEAVVLRRADALVTVTEGWGQRFRALYPRLPCHVIRNGYDIPLVTETRQTGDTFRVVYTGKLDVQLQSLDIFLDGLRAFLATRGHREDVDVAFHCYGDTAGAVRDVLERSHIEAVRFGGLLDHATSAAAQAEASVLLLFPWNRDPDCIPAKLFDYLAAGPPVLVVGDGSSEPARIVREAEAGAVVGTPGEVERTLQGWYEEWRRGSPPAPRAVDKLTNHSFEKRGEAYDALLRSVVGIDSLA